MGPGKPYFAGDRTNFIKARPSTRIFSSTIIRLDFFFDQGIQGFVDVTGFFRIGFFP